VDGRVERLIDLPDRDGKNDGQAKEYDQTFEFAIPPGSHQLSLDNVDWYFFSGEAAAP
jgi:hypothetical protein